MPGFIDNNRKYIVVLAVFLILFWLVTIQVKAGRFSLLERPVLAVSGFFERIITGSYETVASLFRRYAFLVRTERENERLKSEILRLRLESQMTGELLAENHRLLAAIGFQKAAARSSVIIGIIGKETSPSSSTFTVNKGSAHGLVRDLPVITPDGVVGRVHSLLPETAKILLITDPGSTIAVRVERNREEGLLEGKIDRCALKYVSFYMDVQEGDLLVTSGLDGMYPKGLPVAMVTKVLKNKASSFQAVYAEPVVRFSRLEEALVLIK